MHPGCEKKVTEDIRNQRNKEHLVIISDNFSHTHLKKCLCVAMFIVWMYSKTVGS